MKKRKRRRGPGIMSEVLTLRMTEEEMLRFKVAALALGRKRAVLVRERVADLIRPAAAVPAAGPAPTAPTEATAAEPSVGGSCDTVASGTVIGEMASGERSTGQ